MLQPHFAPANAHSMPPPPIQPLMVLDSLKVAEGVSMVALAWIQPPGVPSESVLKLKWRDLR